MNKESTGFEHPPFRDVVLFGSGGHAGVVIDAIRRQGDFRVHRLMDNDCVGTTKYGVQVEEITDDWNGMFAFIAIGDNAIRESLSRKLFNFISVIHPTAQVHSACCFGTYFGANSVVGSGSIVGDFSIINTGVVLEHDSVVGNFSHLAPGVVTGGRVKIGNRTFVGLNSTLRDGITIGDNVVIGCASNVITDVPDDTVWWGNPATFQRCNNK